MGIPNSLSNERVNSSKSLLSRQLTSYSGILLLPLSDPTPGRDMLSVLGGSLLKTETFSVEHEEHLDMKITSVQDGGKIKILKRRLRETNRHIRCNNIIQDEQQLMS